MGCIGQAMEKADRKYMDEFLVIMHQIHIKIKRLLEAGNNESVMGLLEQCQGYVLRFV